MTDESRSTLLLIAYHFHPASEIGARRATALARYLADRGVRVVVVSAFGGARIATGSEILPGVIAIPVREPRRRFLGALVALKQGTGGSAAKPSPGAAPAPERPRRALLRRGVTLMRDTFFQVLYFIDWHKRWGLRAARAAAIAGRAYDACVTLSSSPPFTVLLVGQRVAGRLGIPHVADMRDPWTDGVAPARTFERLSLRLLRRLERGALQSARAVVATTSILAQALERRYPDIHERIHVVRNGYDGRYQQLPRSTDGRLSMLFAGELYFGRDPFPLLEAVDRLLARTDVDPQRVVITFMGRVDTYRGIRLAEWIASNRCRSAVRIVPPGSAADVADAVSRATVLLNLCQDQPYSVPAKTYEHLIAGREILLLCEPESETARLVRGISGVLQVDARDPNALDAALIDLYERHVRCGLMSPPGEAEVSRYSREAANEHFWRVLSSVAPLPAPTQPVGLPS